jgi:hypothetical protein
MTGIQEIPTTGASVTTPTQLIYNEFHSSYPDMLHMLQTNIKNDDIVMGGDIPLRIVLKALQHYICCDLHTQNIYEDENDEGDMDENEGDQSERDQEYYPSIQLFCKNDISLHQFRMAVFRAPPNYFTFGQHQYTGISTREEIHAPNELHAMHSVEMIRACPTHKTYPCAAFINRLDFTPAQVAFQFHPQFGIFVTPAFLFSLFTGQMSFTYSSQITWPFTDIENEYDHTYYNRFDNWYCPDQLLLSANHKSSLLRRYFKFKSFGYCDASLSCKEEKRLHNLFHNLEYHEDDIFCPPIELDTSGYNSDFFAQHSHIRGQFDI